MNKKLYLNIGIMLSVFVFLLAGLKFYVKNTNVKSLESINILPVPLSFIGNKSIAAKEITVTGTDMKNKNALGITYNLNGICLLKGKAAQVSLIQKDNSANINLSDFLDNCSVEIKTSFIPLDKIPGLDKSIPIEKLSFSFWYPTDYRIDILNFTVNSVDENVLGVENLPDIPQGPNSIQISPLRPFPYAEKSIE